MGTLAHFDVFNLVSKYGLLRFAETGTGKGDSLAFALQEQRFVALTSCEVEPSLAMMAMERFRDESRVVVHLGTSMTCLDFLCHRIPREDPILFWLDAHFPGADYKIRSYDHEPDTSIRLPLEDELDLLSAYRDGLDVILVDDLRIYKDGPFGHGNLPENIRSLCPIERNIDFVHQFMGATHDIVEDYAHEGYIVMTPKRLRM